MKKAFTLLELVITLIVVAILAAVILPVLVSHPRYYSGPSCLSNVKNLGTTQNMYRQDYDEVLPPMQTPEVFKRVVWIYIKSDRTFSCPSFRLPYIPLASLSYVPAWRIEKPAEAEFLRDPDYHLFSNPEHKTLNIGFVDGHAKTLPAPPPPATILSGPKPPAKPEKANRTSH